MKYSLPFGTFVHQHKTTFNSSPKPTSVSFTKLSTSLAYQSQSESIRKLFQKDVNMLRRMEEIGHSILDTFNVPVSKRKMGFHIPPFNSIHHLHLHVQSLPYISPIHRLKYPFVRGFGGYEKGFSWFAEIGQAIRILEKGHRVTVAPC
ncbi:uncharacterized protein F5147DRAFT_210035 [Suillus discolor]|uniref:HIT domain-containing protein n=1 Tax=Suillus discolor TaxID=1912936 RepID=A0A9P7F6F4_9AGAM|nr:uncharacterized protein F5147DRAFT_210035 [Suillus discolor]KAG2107179.1 hypothetical protein F5147DRAFT_210035 [Suillus discolor]